MEMGVGLARDYRVTQGEGEIERESLSLRKRQREGGREI